MVQLRGELRTLHFLHKLLFSGVLLAAIGLLWQFYRQQPSCWYVIAVIVALVLMAQLSRSDKSFIYLHLSRPRTAIFTEYFLLSLPFTLPLLFTSNWYCFPLFPVAFAIISQLQITVSSPQVKYRWLAKFIPAQQFEWLSGLRQALPVFALLYAVALTFCWVKALPLFLLWLLNTMVLSFYQEGEPLQLLRIYAETPKLLLRKKLVEHSKLLLILNLPVIALQGIFYPLIGLIGIVFLALQLISLAFAIFLKYSTYAPNQSAKSNTLLLTLAQLGVIFPFLLLVPLAMCFRYYGRAIRNLALYLPA
jgi:hypothetical protein